MHRLVKPRRKKMSTLYTMVVGKKDVIVLNRNYTDEQLREKLSVPGDGYDEDWINYILENGIRIPEGKCKVVRIWHRNTIIRTQFHFSRYYAHWGYKVIIHPDGSFERTPGIFIRIRDWMDEIRNHFFDSGDQKKRER